MSEELNRTNLYQWHVKHSGRMMPFAGWEMPVQYPAGPIEEHHATRRSAGLFDIDHMGQITVTGPDAEAYLNQLVTWDVNLMAENEAHYAVMCYENGGMIDDGTVFRLGQNNFRWIGGSDESGIWLREQADALGLQAWVRNSTDQLHNLQVQGPKSRDVLKQVIWTRPDQPTLEELKWFRFSIARIGDDQGIPLVVSRTGCTGGGMKRRRR